MRTSLAPGKHTPKIPLPPHMTEGPDPRFAWATPRTGGVLAAAAGTALLGCIVWQPAGRAHGAPAHFKFLGQHQEALRIPGVVPVEDKTPLPPLPALPRLKASSTHQALQLVASTDVYFGGGSFAARQKSTVLLERQAPFERSGVPLLGCASYLARHVPLHMRASASRSPCARRCGADGMLR
jgi:hypothetical protein